MTAIPDPRNVETYDIAGMLSLLRNSDALSEIPAEERRASLARLRRLIALNVGDPIRLEQLLGHLPSYEDFYGPQTPDTPQTSEAIDLFLTTYAKGKRIPDDAPLVAVPAIDYATLLAAEQRGEAFPDSEDGDVIPACDDTATEQPVVPLTLEEMIKNRRYDAAIEIIQRQNLNNPEKSVYFAEQLRFLRKLQLIETWSSQG